MHLTTPGSASKKRAGWKSLGMESCVKLDGEER